MELTQRYFNLFIKSLQDAIKCAKEYNHMGICISECSLISNLQTAIEALLVVSVGQLNANLVTEYVFTPENSKFKSNEELYAYLNDEYSNLVCDDNALTLKQLMQIFPDERMFKFFAEKIDKNA